MGDWTSKAKRVEEIQKDLEGLGYIAIDKPLPLAMIAAIQVRLIDKLCDAIDTASRDFVIQSNGFKECIEGARNNFVTESGALRKSMGEIRSSLEEFRKSNEKSSNALTVATYVLACVALVQTGIFVLQWLK
jgi:hypothetical protein